MNTDLTELKRLAKAATPGPWGIEKNVHAGGVCHLAITNRSNGRDWMPCSITRADLAREVDFANAAFIAAANPTTVMELIEEIERLKEIDRLRKLNATRTVVTADMIETLRWSVIWLSQFSGQLDAPGREDERRRLGTIIDELLGIIDEAKK